MYNEKLIGVVKVCNMIIIAVNRAETYQKLIFINIYINIKSRLIAVMVSDIKDIYAFFFIPIY
jgi:hypothetical protein